MITKLFKVNMASWEGKEGGRVHLNQRTLVAAPELASICPAEVSSSRTLNLLLSELLL